jgi:hypothetical protein
MTSCPPLRLIVFFLSVPHLLSVTSPVGAEFLIRWRKRGGGRRKRSGKDPEGEEADWVTTGFRALVTSGEDERQMASSSDDDFDLSGSIKLSASRKWKSGDDDDDFDFDVSDQEGNASISFAPSLLLGIP